MGPAIAVKADNNGYFNINPNNVTTSEDLQQLHDRLLADSWQATSAFFEHDSDAIEKCRVYGSDIAEDPDYLSIQDSAKIRSFVVKSRGGAVRFALEDDSVTIDRYGGSTRTANPDLPDFQTVYFVATVMLYAIHSVDEFIERNGLRPVVDEVRERRWAIIVTCTILTAYCQLGSC